MSSLFFNTRYLAPVDLDSDDQAISIRAEIPGLQKENIDISYDNGVVEIRGEKKSNASSTSSGYVVREISYGQFSRQIRVGDVDFDQAQATYENGVLSITLPKTTARKNRKLVVA